MALPTPTVTAATQAAQTSLPQDPASQPKQGASKFDAMMDRRTDLQQVQNAQVNASQNAQQTQAAQNAQKLEAVQEVDKKERTLLHKNDSGRVSFTGVTRGSDTSKAESLITKLVQDMESGQKVMDRLIKAGMSGRDFSSTELITLQAGMYKYTQELELTGKVVEKATSGLKDTLRTQV